MITTPMTTSINLESVTTTTAGTQTGRENLGVLPTPRILGLKDGTFVRLIVVKKVKVSFLADPPTVLVVSHPKTGNFAADDCWELASRGSDYRGTVNKTISGYLCQKWSSQSPHKHDYYTDDKINHQGIGDHNYCRNPDEDSQPWCLTTEKNRTADYCDLRACATGKPDIVGLTITKLLISFTFYLYLFIEFVECVSYRSNGSDYRGTINKTESGLTCQKWSTQSPHSHNDYTEITIAEYGIGDHNYCRNPGGGKSHPWCYTAHKNKRFQYCDVPICIIGKFNQTKTRNSRLIGTASG